MLLIIAIHKIIKIGKENRPRKDRKIMKHFEKWFMSGKSRD